MTELNDQNSVRVPRIKLICDTCYWRQIKYKGRSCADLGYGPEHDACKNWTAQRPTPDNRHVYDLRIQLAKLSVPELNAFHRFVKEALLNKGIDTEVSVGQSVQYHCGDDTPIQGICVNLSSDKHGSYVHLLSDEGTLIQALVASVTPIEPQSDTEEPCNGCSTDTEAPAQD